MITAARIWICELLIELIAVETPGLTTFYEGRLEGLRVDRDLAEDDTVETSAEAISCVETDRRDVDGPLLCVERLLTPRLGATDRSDKA